MNVQYISPAITAVSGFTPEQHYADPYVFLRYTHPDDIATLETRLRDPQPTGGDAIRWVTPSGSIRHVEVRQRVIHDGDGRPVAIEGTARDVSAAVERQSRLEMLAHHDHLTGVLNRRALDEHLADRLRRGTPTAVLFLDLDGFKGVNDHHGHDAGDELLVRVSTRLAATVRSEDRVARLAGDEFIIVCDPAAAEPIARRLLKDLAEPIELRPGTAASVGVSIGLAIACDGEPAQALLRRADEAMYLAKRRGKHQVARL